MKKQKLTKDTLIRAFDWGYEKAVTGTPNSCSALELAEQYKKRKGDLTDKANALILKQKLKCATSGFLSGIGGLYTIPITLPLNITFVMYCHIRMITAIAHMGGHDIYDPKVKTLVFLCLSGNVAKDIMEDIGIRVGAAMGQEMYKQISSEIIKQINHIVGMRLLAQSGGKGTFILGRSIPFLGGAIGATSDALATHAIGKAAKLIFLEGETSDKIEV